MAQKYHIIPEFPEYGISVDCGVINLKTQERLTEYPLSGFSYVNIDGIKVPTPVLYVWTFVGRGKFRITTDKTGYTYLPPLDTYQISEDEYFLGDNDTRPEEAEYFKRIPGFSQYLISPTGLIYNIERYKFLHRTYNHGNYLVATLTDDTGFRSPRKVHRLVYAAFVGPIDESMTIDHIDGVRWNNDPRNLRVLRVANNTIRGQTNRSFTEINWDPEDIDIICEKISEGKQTHEILKAFDYNKYRGSYNNGPLVDLIFNIRTGKAYKDTMLKYVSSIEEIPYVGLPDEPTKYNRPSAIYSNPPAKKENFNFRDKQYKLTPRDVLNIKSLLSQGHTFQEIADKYHVNQSSIGEIASGKTWKTLQ